MKKLILTTTTVAALSLTGLVVAQDNIEAGKPKVPMVGKDPHLTPDDRRISISGKITSVNATSFELDYTLGTVTVEMDDYDSYREAYNLWKGDRVTVYGDVDRDPGETTKIEAASVYVKGMNAFFYANRDDEEDYQSINMEQRFPVDGNVTSFSGYVSAVSDDSFTLKTDVQTLEVSIKDMPYNPLDNQGYQKVKVGDRVSVIGTYDYNLLSRNEVDAMSVTTLIYQEDLEQG